MAKVEASHPRDRKLPYIFSWGYEFAHPIEKIWPLISDTDLMNRAAMVPAPEYYHEPAEHGGSLRWGEFTVMFCMHLKWRENIYEWIEPQFFRVERTYEKGPLEQMNVHWDLEATEDNGCLVVQTIACKPSSALLGPILRIEVGMKTRRNFLRAYEHLDHYLAEKEDEPFLPTKEDRKWQDHENRDILKGWLEMLTDSSSLPNKLSDYIFSTYPREIKRIRPLALARELDENPLDILTTLFKGEKDKIFKASWDLLCPSCRGPQGSVETPDEVWDTVHCESCNLTSDVDFDKAVELTFAVSEKMREVEVQEFCIGGPQNTPHGIAHLRIGPGEALQVEVNMEEGGFLATSLQASPRYRIRVEPQGESKAELNFIEEGPPERQVIVAPGKVLFEILNPYDWEISVMIETAEWLQDVCSPNNKLYLEAYRRVNMDGKGM